VYVCVYLTGFPSLKRPSMTPRPPANVYTARGQSSSHGEQQAVSGSHCCTSTMVVRRTSSAVELAVDEFAIVDVAIAQRKDSSTLLDAILERSHILGSVGANVLALPMELVVLELASVYVSRSELVH